MATEPGTPQLRLQAWREQGADRIAPLQFARINALAARAERYDGLARQQLDARLRQLVDHYEATLARQPPPPAAAASSERTSGPLQSLLALLSSEPLQYPLPLAAAQPAGNDDGGGTGEATAPAPLPALDEFQQLWGRIRIDSLLRQCLDSLPEDAGPLHSSVLTYRAMALMQEVAPDYLQHFIAYVDVLTWMEPISGTDTVVEPVRVASKRKSSPRRKK